MKKLLPFLFSLANCVFCWMLEYTSYCCVQVTSPHIGEDLNQFGQIFLLPPPAYFIFVEVTLQGYKYLQFLQNCHVLCRACSAGL